MKKSIQVQIMGRAYSLRVEEGAEALTREMAAHVHDKMQAFRDAHPEQSETTAAVISALAVAEELYAAREHEEAVLRALDEELLRLDGRLVDALQPTEDEPEEADSTPLD